MATTLDPAPFLDSIDLRSGVSLFSEIEMMRLCRRGRLQPDKLIKSVGNPLFYPLESKVAAVREVKPFLLGFSNQASLLEYRLGGVYRHLHNAAFITMQKI